jgi:hypothetical protein
VPVQGAIQGAIPSNLSQINIRDKDFPGPDAGGKPGCVLDWSLNLTSEPTTTMDDNDDMQDIDDFDASEFDVDDRTTFV